MCGRVGAWVCGLVDRCVWTTFQQCLVRKISKQHLLYEIEENQCGSVFFIVSDSLGQIIDRTKSLETKDHSIVL